MNDFNKTALIIGLRKLFDPHGTFYITDFDQLLALAGATITSADRKPFAVLHCVKYADMPEGFRRELFAKTIEIFKQAPAIELNIDEIFPPKQVAQRRVLRFLEGYK